MNAELYLHPEGYRLDLTQDLLTATNDEDESVSIPIGPRGWIALGELLVAFGKSLEFHEC